MKLLNEQARMLAQNVLKPLIMNSNKRGTRNHQQRVSRKFFIRYMQNFDQYLMTQKKPRLALLLQIFLNILKYIW